MSRRKKRPSITLDETIQLLRPRKAEESLPVPLSDWRRYIERVRRIGDYSSLFSHGVGTSLGIAATAIVGALALPGLSDFDKTKVPTVLWVVGIGAAVLALALFLVNLFHRSDRKELKSAIIDDMEAFAAKFIENDENGN